MALVSLRNQELSEAAAGDRAKQFLTRIKEALVAAGWSFIGCGDGVDDVSVNLAGGATDYFPTFPAITGLGDGAWFAVENAGGAQLVFQNPSADDVFMYWSASGAYTDDSPTHSVRLGGTTPPADEITMQQSYAGFGTYAGQKFTIIYDDTATSFIVFGAYGSNQPLGGFFLTLNGIKTGDSTPYVAWWYFRSGYDVWDYLYNPVADDIMGWHPGGSAREYCFGRSWFDGVDMMSIIGPDPVSGDDPLMDCLVGCQEPTAYQIRGVAPYIKWMSDLRSTGNKFDSDRYMGVGQVAIDGWNSEDALES